MFRVLQGILFQRVSLLSSIQSSVAVKLFATGELCLISEDTSPADIHFFVKLDGNCLSCHSCLLQQCFRSRRCSSQLQFHCLAVSVIVSSDFDLSTFDLTLETTECHGSDGRLAVPAYRILLPAFCLCSHRLFSR